MEIAGIDADSIITQLMQLEERPLRALEARKESARLAATAIDRIGSNVTAFELAAAKLSLPSAFEQYTSTVSDPSVVGATVSGAASPGSLVFTVDRLAQSHGLRSLSTVASSTTAITAETVIAAASGTTQIGIASVKAGAGLGVSAFELSVIESSAAARVTGASAPAATTDVDATNNTLDLTVDGVAHSVTIADGTYDAAGLAAAVQDALDGAGVGATATIDAAGVIDLSTAREGSAASIRITGGNATGDLGLAIDAADHVGVDAKVDIDGTETVLTDVLAGAGASIDTGAGTLDVQFSGGLRAGSTDVAVVSTGDRSLADVAAALTKAGVGVNASAVRVDASSWRLQLSATRTGVDGVIALDTSVFTGLGGMVESSAAQNAQMTIGSGVGAYSIEASGNTFTDVMPGVTLTAKQVDTTPVTVNVTRNDTAIADQVSKMVSAANTILGDISASTRTNPGGGSGALAGNSTIRRLADRIRDALGSQVSGLSVSLTSSVGIERDRDGGFTFDRATFLDAMADDPDAITRLFTQGGTDTGDVTFAEASARTSTGSYDVDVTAPATQATSALMFDGGAATGTRVGVRIDDTTVTLDVSAGRTPAQIVADLNDAFATNGLDLVAETSDGGLRVRANSWGSAGAFEVNTDLDGAGTWDESVGDDVAGTIDGFLATGTGRRLRLPGSVASPAAGIAVDVTATAPAFHAGIEYRPGIAARVVEITTALNDTEIGTITTAQTFAESRVDSFDDQIDRLEDRLIVREANLRRQWSSMQTLLSGLQSQGSWLGSQLSNLSNNWKQN